MEDNVTPDVSQEKETPTDSSTENKPTEETSSVSTTADTTQPSDKGGEENPSGDDEHRIPKHRLDEEIAKRKRLEEEVQTLTDRFSRMGDALSGKEKQVQDAELEELSKKYNVDPSFLKDMSGYFEKKAEEKFRNENTTVKKSLAEMHYDRELNQLEKKYSDARDMSDEERKELKKLAHSQRFRTTPLEDIYKVMTYDKPRGSSKTVESSRPGGAPQDSGEAPDISKMSVEEFKKFSDNLAKNS